ncbi:MAG: cytochrome C [Burkholderiales bacterium]|nr:MAG: cytochrome C [Burkholderiales bacterium]
MPWTPFIAAALNRKVGGLFVRILLVPLFLLFATQAMAQGIESILAPGKVIQGHAKLEDDCKQCHVKFDRKAQDGLCMACHKDVGADVRARTGFHGRSKSQACSTCHTDHKGRAARIVELDQKTFDHNVTDYRLKGKHDKVVCTDCHQAGKKYSEAPMQCNACHKKDDTHKGALGAQCADCHAETGWKDTRFDHEKDARFALSGKHADAKCTACHKNNVYKDTPKTCIGCHRKDDDSAKGHKGQFGEKCDTCHSARAWKPADFNHDTDTRYVLRGKHRSTTCADCHSGPIYKVKLSQDCYACHKRDDKHKESLGKDCGSCHTERSWKEPAKFNHDQTSFPLLGKHVNAECKACHKSSMFKEAPKDCVGCHKKDDKHESTLGDRCGDCHAERDWKTTKGRFNHDTTQFKLRNAHAESLVKCSACHKDLKSFRKTPLDCYSCHKKDDKHEGQQGLKCETCHSDQNWKTTKFDHGQTRFPLTGKHVPVKCEKCHESSRYKDAPMDCMGCHQKDDRHKLKFGVACESCHNTRGWAIWDFDHTRRTSYRLDGGHLKVACESCHTQPAPKGKASATVGSSCMACHRKDDVHDGQFGVRCETCHVTSNWKKVLGRVSRNATGTGMEAVLQSMSPLGMSSRWGRAGSAPADRQPTENRT